MAKWLIFVTSIVLVVLSIAGELPAAGQDQALEKHVMAISEQLRCLVCQNQTIADSHADLATDLKNQVREKIRQGKSDREIFDFMVERYGDFVLYRPPLQHTTWLLWFGPFIMLLGGLIFLVVRLRDTPLPEELTESELKRSAELLGNESTGKERS